MINGISRSEQNRTEQSSACKFVFFITLGTFNLNFIFLAVLGCFCGFDFFLLTPLNSVFFFFLLACKEEYFGTNCSWKCSPHCKIDKCRHTDGWCTCDAGLRGGKCTRGRFGRIFIILLKYFLKNKQRRTSAVDTGNFK